MVINTMGDKKGGKIANLGDGGENFTFIKVAQESLSEVDKRGKALKEVKKWCSMDMQKTCIPGATMR